MLAHFGEVHPETLKSMLAGPVAAFEVFLDALPAEKKKGLAKRALEAADLLPVRRDFAFVLDAGVPAGDVIRAAHGRRQDADRRRQRVRRVRGQKPRRGQEVAGAGGDAAAHETRR